MAKSRHPRLSAKKAPESYRERTYRRSIDPGGLIASFIKVQQTDLHILAPTDVRALALDAVHRLRNQLENYIAAHPRFLTALVPLATDPLAPPLVRQMLAAGLAAGVGPMAAVAGAIAEAVGREILAAGAEQVVVENGGDIFLHKTGECVAAIFAGASPLSRKVGIRVPAGRMPTGLCTSSGTVGHSLSFGQADAVAVLSSSTALADAVATRVGNEVHGPRDIEAALQVAQAIPGLSGVVIIAGKHLGAWGEVELVKLQSLGPVGQLGPV